ncbi:hypothetical protein [Lacihabitans sp. CCS-44]|uniref:hypothetical protein n=1 Tax=Lacihabitans sp. CCS-44 TaxID=2487331 RepID=UPI0020CFB291|nr:hypothetical protein [Lacihabitans sp. CCS-44]
MSQILEPLKIVKDETKLFLVWFIFTILAGQIGIFTNVILKYKVNNIAISQSMIEESIIGSFFTFAIVLFASTLGLLFVNILERNPTVFKSFKVFLLIVTVFSLFFAGIYYSASTISIRNPIETKIENYSIDWPQVIFFILSIIFAVYTYCITRLDLNYEKYQHLDDNYAEKDNEKVEELQSGLVELDKDKKGNRL